ncbi:MAG: hypothetical protein WBG90_09810, partial [Saonia sp.]
MKTTIICTMSLIFSLITNAQFQTRIIEDQIEAIWYENKSERISKLNKLLTDVPSELDDVEVAEADYWMSYV